MHRRRLFAILSAGCALAAGLSFPARAAAPRYARGLLWRVDRPGVKPSYLFGTLHVPDPRLLPLPAPVADAFARCRRLIVEMLPNPAISARFSEAMRFEGGDSLDALLPPADFERLAERLAAQGLAPEAVRRLKPWAALLLITAAPPAAADTVSLDTELFVRARYANRPVEELDTVEEQIAVFDDVPADAQLALLRATLDHPQVIAESAERAMAAYLARDLAALQRAGRLLESRVPTLVPHQRVLEKKVIVDRSVVMAYRMQYYLRRGESFAAIGASHLAGPQGVPAILADEYDWRVAAVW